MSCEHCENIKLTNRSHESLFLKEVVAHDFIIAQDENYTGIFYYDSDRGWEGTEINYCPWCGEKLVDSPKTIRDLTPTYFEFCCNDEKKREKTRAEILDGEATKEPTTRAEILDAAKQCVCTDRNEQYGAPEESLGAIAEFWETYLNYKKGQEIHIDAEDAAAMMVLFKTARISTGKSKTDNWVDLAGYSACGGEISARNNQ